MVASTAREDAPRLSAAAYLGLAEGGHFDGERVELLAGQVQRMTPQGWAHVRAVARLHRLLESALQTRAWTLCQSAFAAGADSVPEPDIAVVRELPRGGLSSAALLVVEVSCSSLRRDRTIKPAIYASADVPEYWIVDIDAGEIEVLRDPADGEYRECRRYGSGESIALVRFPEIEIDVDAVLA